MTEPKKAYRVSLREVRAPNTPGVPVVGFAVEASTQDEARRIAKARVGDHGWTLIAFSSLPGEEGFVATVQKKG